MNLPNKISIFRLLLVPGIVASLIYYAPDRDGLRFVALALFLIGVVSDAVDGYIARRHRLQTELGTLLDPIADKFLILGTLISCSVIQGLPAWMHVPAWFNLIVISRDVLLVAGAAVLFIVKGRWHVRPSWMGKCTTVAQMSVILAMLLGWPVAGWLLPLAAACTVFSGIIYIRAGVAALS